MTANVMWKEVIPATVPVTAWPRVDALRNAQRRSLAVGSVRQRARAASRGPKGGHPIPLGPRAPPCHTAEPMGSSHLSASRKEASRKALSACLRLTPSLPRVSSFTSPAARSSTHRRANFSRSGWTSGAS